MASQCAGIGKALGSRWERFGIRKLRQFSFPMVFAISSQCSQCAESQYFSVVSVLKRLCYISACGVPISACTTTIRSGDVYAQAGLAAAGPLPLCHHLMHPHSLGCHSTRHQYPAAAPTACAFVMMPSCPLRPCPLPPCHLPPCHLVPWAALAQAGVPSVASHKAAATSTAARKCQRIALMVGGSGNRIWQQHHQQQSTMSLPAAGGHCLKRYVQCMRKLTDCSDISSLFCSAPVRLGRCSCCRVSSSPCRSCC